MVRSLCLHQFNETFMQQEADEFKLLVTNIVLRKCTLLRNLKT